MRDLCEYCEMEELDSYGHCRRCDEIVDRELAGRYLAVAHVHPEMRLVSVPGRQQLSATGGPLTTVSRRL